jgi:hypothetical protein
MISIKLFSGTHHPLQKPAASSWYFSQFAEVGVNTTQKSQGLTVYLACQVIEDLHKDYRMSENFMMKIQVWQVPSLQKVYHIDEWIFVDFILLAALVSCIHHRYL